MKGVRKLALAVAAVALLSAVVLSANASARSWSTRAPKSVGPVAPLPPLAAPAPKHDLDGDRLFEDLEQRLRFASPSERLDVIVRLRDEVTRERVAALERLAGGFSAGRRFELVNGFEATVTPAQAEALARSARVTAVELDSIVRAANDTAQASFGVTDARLQAPGLDGSADGNVDVYTPADLVAAVVDTGVDAAHADLDEGKVLAFRDFVNGQSTPYDDDGHGSHVAGTIAGEGDARADRRYRGVAPGAGIVGVKVLDGNGNGTEANVLAGIQWVVSNRALHGTEAMNLSLSAAGCSDGTDAMSAAVNAAHDAGIFVSVAAGNEGPGTCTIGSPSAAAKPTTVGSMADFGVRGFYQAFDSSRGKTADGRIKPDVSAPGVGVTSVDAGSGSGYIDFSGTSMATPFVAGVALLMLDANPALAPQGVKDRIMGTAIDWARGGDNRTAGTSGPDIDYGAGRLDAHEALRLAGAPVERSPSMPAHQLREGSLSGTGTQIDYDIQVNDTRFPVAATMIHALATAGSSTNPDFDLFLFDPSGQEVASSEFTTRQEEVGHLPATLGTYKLRVRSFRGSGPFFVDISAGSALPGYARPQGAVNARVPLVIAYEPCAAPGNRTHGPSLTYPSCSPPQQQSDHLTVGTLDSNGQDTRSVASVRMTVLPGDSNTSADEADVRLSLGATDIRRRGDLADYTGELQARVSIRITDRSNGPSFADPGTVVDVPFSFTAACAGTSDPSVGSSCAATTTADATVPGAVVEGKRAIWELGQIEVLDGGADGVASTGPNTVFARQGVFTP